MAKIRISDLLVARLAEKYGVRHVFMMCGGGAMHLNDAVGLSPKISYICNHHEQAAAIGAEGYFRTCGNLGVVIVTSGPGGLNTLTGVMGQWTDSIPVLYLSGQIKRETAIFTYPHLHLRQLGDQEGPIAEVVKPITKFSAVIDDPLKARMLLDKAVYLALEGRPGPVWLDIPLDIQGALVEEDDLVDFVPPVAIQEISHEAVDKAARMIRDASRPVFIAGHGIKISGGRDIFERLANRLGMPVVTTFNGIDLMPSDHPLFVGRIGTLGSRSGNFVLQNADLIVCVGSRNNIRQVSYAWDLYGRSGKKIVVDIDEAELKKPTVIPDLPIRMDARLFMKVLEEKLASQKLPDWSAWVAWGKERNLRYPVVLEEYRETKHAVHPYCFTDELTRQLPEKAIVVCGNGSACVTGFQAGRVKRNQTFFWNSGCATMGYDLPAAIGASIARGKAPVVCVTGDGSIMLNLQELATIAYYQLPIKIFILNNKGYVSMRQTQGSFFDGRIVAADADSGVGFPNFQHVAAAFGIPSRVLDNFEGAPSIISDTLNASGPVLCEVICPADYVFAPKLSSEKLPDGRLISKPLEDLSPLLSREEFISNMIVEPLDAIADTKKVA